MYLHTSLVYISLSWGKILSTWLEGKVDSDIGLKGVWHEIFDFKFFSWISIPLEPVWIFSKIRGYIRELIN